MSNRFETAWYAVPYSKKHRINSFNLPGKGYPSGKGYPPGKVHLTFRYITSSALHKHMVKAEHGEHGQDGQRQK